MSIPISDPLAVPTRPTLSALSGMRSSPAAVRSTMAADSSPMRPLPSSFLQDAQRLVGLARLREPNDHHVFLSHCHSVRSNIDDDRNLSRIDAKRC
jgi:hypothetical protein